VIRPSGGKTRKKKKKGLKKTEGRQADYAAGEGNACFLRELFEIIKKTEKRGGEAKEKERPACTV